MYRQHNPIKLIWGLKILVINVIFTHTFCFLSVFFGVTMIIWITFLRLLKKD